MSGRLDIFGGGAFGTALAIAYGRAGLQVTLWARDPEVLIQTRQAPNLPGHTVPEAITITGDARACTAETALLAVPTQALGVFLSGTELQANTLICCAKGIDRASGLSPTDLIAQHLPKATIAQLTGPSFAADIARGLPTALTLACADDRAGAALQTALSTADLRLYRTIDVIGAALGGALKNVIAIAAGVVIGAGLGDSARAALIARGFAEMTRYATAKGARPETLTGLSGLGDLILTCGSTQSRNFRFGHALATGKTLPGAPTIEGLHTARLLSQAPEDTPIADIVAALADGKLDSQTALAQLLSRPLKPE